MKKEEAEKLLVAHLNMMALEAKTTEAKVEVMRSFLDKLYESFEKDIVADMPAFGTKENDFLLNGFDVSIPYLEAQPGQKYRIIIKETK